MLATRRFRPLSGVRAFSGRDTPDEIKDFVEADARAYNAHINKSMEVKMGTNEVTRRVRTRYAPSPTGMMHIGGLRTALYNYLFAKQHGGDFLLRIEDTDKNREVEGSTEDIVEMLRWAGIHNSEGPGSAITETSQGHSYFQSERLPIYHKYIETLLENGDAYPCFCTTERLQEMRIQIGGQKYAKAMYDRFCPTTYNAD